MRKITRKDRRDLKELERILTEAAKPIYTQSDRGYFHDGDEVNCTDGRYLTSEGVQKACTAGTGNTKRYMLYGDGVLEMDIYMALDYARVTDTKLFTPKEFVNHIAKSKTREFFREVRGEFR